MADLYEHIGNRIRELRLSYSLGPLNQEALAKKLGIAANTLSRWETGTYKPTPEDLDKLARFFEISIIEFFPGLKNDDPRVTALASSTGGLSKSDFEEVVRYAEFRKARALMESKKRRQSKARSAE